ncbi:MAG: aspartate kinase, partial [Odoribacter sp.]|nr:aspartate kinase [Odoribacter sp.]
IEVDRDMAIVCIVGDFAAGKAGLDALVLNALSDVPLRMISYGGSEHNISVLVKEEDKKKAMSDLSHKLLDVQE